MCDMEWSSPVESCKSDDLEPSSVFIKSFRTSRSWFDKVLFRSRQSSSIVFNWVPKADCLSLEVSLKVGQYCQACAM